MKNTAGKGVDKIELPSANAITRHQSMAVARDRNNLRPHFAGAVCLLLADSILELLRNVYSGTKSLCLITAPKQIICVTGYRSLPFVVPQSGKAGEKDG